LLLALPVRKTPIAMVYTSKYSNLSCIFIIFKNRRLKKTVKSLKNDKAELEQKISETKQAGEDLIMERPKDEQGNDE